MSAAPFIHSKIDNMLIEIKKKVNLISEQTTYCLYVGSILREVFYNKEKAYKAVERIERAGFIETEGTIFSKNITT